MRNGFFAVLSRMKYIPRWTLMRNSRQENICEHSYEVTVLAHALAVITNRRFGGQIDAGHCALLALYHDAPEIFTGDMPTPVKYFNPAIRQAYQQVETVSADKLLSLLPPDLRVDFTPLLHEEASVEEARIVKAADKLSALIKCVEERNNGNAEFKEAYASTLTAVRALQLPAADTFLEEFLPAYSLTLDEQGQ